MSVRRLTALAAAALSTLSLGALSTPAHADSSTGRITVKVVDAATGHAVPDVCVTVEALPGTDGFPGCVAMGSGTSEVPPGKYKLFASASTGSRYGSEWAKSDGSGTGDYFQAAIVTIKAGSATVFPAIKLRHAGSISGTVIDRATGKPLAGVDVQTGAFGLIGDAVGTIVETDSHGRYRMDNLGPFSWPLTFDPAGPSASRNSDAFQWYSGASDRAHAMPVTVRSGRVSTANAALVRDGVVGGHVKLADGTPVTDGWVFAVDAHTGDDFGFTNGALGWSKADPSSFDIRHLPRNATVKLEVFRDGVGAQWYGGTSFATATPVHLDGARTTVNITLSK